MYLQLEQNILLPKGKILGIFDMDHATWEKNTRKFLAQAEVEGRVFALTQDLPHSFVLVGENFGTSTVYLSGRSSISLARRMGQKIYEQHLILDGTEENKLFLQT